MANANASTPGESPMAPADSPNSEPRTNEQCGPTIEVTDDLPSKEVLGRAIQLPIFDAEGKEHLFGELFNELRSPETKRVLVIFIRHFFCGSCQEYIRALVSSIQSPSSLPAGISLAIIGCGSPSLIPTYREKTGCPFPLYTDPTKQLFSLFGMARTLSLGQKPDYIQRSLTSMVADGMMQALTRVWAGDAHKSGDVAQVGGEFLFESETGKSTNDTDGIKVTWCHRMKNTRDHTDISSLRRVMGFDSE